MKTIKLPHSINQSLNEFSVFSCSKYNNLKIGNDNLGRNKLRWCPKKYADIKRQANNGISIVQNFLLKQRNLANLNY